MHWEVKEENKKPFEREKKYGTIEIGYIKVFYEIRKRWFDGQKIKVRQKVGLEYCKTILWVSLFKLENGNIIVRLKL